MNIMKFFKKMSRSHFRRTRFKNKHPFRNRFFASMRQSTTAFVELLSHHHARVLKYFSGFSLIEILLVIAIFGAAFSTILVSLSGQISSIQSSSDNLRVSSIASEAIDATRAIRDADWEDLEIGTHGLTYADGVWSFSGSSDEEDGFTRTITVAEVSENERKVSVDVSWTGTAGQVRSYGYSTMLANWRNLNTTEAGGTLTGDWHAPVFIGNTLDFGNGFRGIAEDIDGNFLYVAGYGSVSTANELVVVDVSNPLTPLFRGSINTGTGINKIAVDPAKKYVYAANASKTYQLQVISVSNPDSLSLKKQYGISGSTNTGRSIDFANNTIYLGTEGPNTPGEFFVIDVTTPTSPSLKGAVTVGNDVNDVNVYGNYAYIGSDVDNREVGIIDVSVPTSPVVKAWIDLPGVNNVEDLYFDSVTSRLYVGRQTDTVAGTPEMVILDVANPSDPQIVGELDYDVSLDSMYAEGNLMIITALGDLEFKAYDVTNLPAIVYYGGIDFGVDDSPTDIVYSDNVFYVTVWQRYALRIISAY
jgi:prepilin-type N-terminal cleavage/methylation domain-containing protein